MKKFFNMIEVTLAIAVIGIGIAGIMSLFPVALNSSKNAVGNNYSSQVADQFLTYLTRVADSGTWTAAGISGIQNTKPLDTQDGHAVATWTDVFGNIKSATDGVLIYKVTQGTNTMEDFSAVVRIWQSAIGNLSIGSTTVAVPQDFATRVYVEVSWPVSAIYTNRQTRVYVMELFNYKQKSNL